LKLLLLPATNSKQALLAVFGWQVLDQQPKVLVCDACHTQCAFMPSPVDDDDIELEEEGPTGFDVVQAHKWYCYWVDPEHDRTGGRQGWKIFLDLVLSQSRSTTRPGESGDTAIEGAERTRLQVRRLKIEQIV